MAIDKETRLIARLHTEDNGTGLNIYNPYFEAVGINAIYMLFKNKRPEPLVNCLRDLGATGAITAGFEHDDVLPTLVDEKSEAAELAGRIGIIANRGGKLYAHYQGGEGLMAAIAEKTEISGKSIVVVGAGTVAKTLLLALEQSAYQPTNITVVNRSSEHAEWLGSRFSDVNAVQSLAELPSLNGDILVNASRIGSSVEDTFFTHDIVSRFKVVADVTFGDPNTNLISLASQSELVTVDGWDMFTHQASVVLHELLGHDADISQLRQFVAAGLSSSNHGAIPKQQ